MNCVFCNFLLLSTAFIRNLTIMMFPQLTLPQLIWLLMMFFVLLLSLVLIVVILSVVSLSSLKQKKKVKEYPYKLSRSGGGGGRKKKSPWRTWSHYLCCVLFCPPCPVNIISNVAFFPPKPPSYCIRNEESILERSSSSSDNTDSTRYGQKSKCDFKKPNRLVMHIRASSCQHSARTIVIGDKVDFFSVPTQEANQIACLYYRPYIYPLYVILYSHPNACDLGTMWHALEHLSSQLRANIFSYDYSGYGVSTGSPSEKNQLADADAAWSALWKTYRIPLNKIILYGQSIGSVATVCF